MDEGDQGVSKLRSRKRMVPTRLTSGSLPPSATQSMTSTDPTIELQDLKPQHPNGSTFVMQGVSQGNDDENDDDNDEEETLFDQNVDTRPLLNTSSELDRRGPADVDTSEDTGDIREETWFEIALQVFFPYIVAGFGTVGAGMVLDVIQHWDVFVHISEIFILVPALLGLKGNLEMTLASRLSTQANLGNLDKRSTMWSLIGGNMALIQVFNSLSGILGTIGTAIECVVTKWNFVQNKFLLCQLNRWCLRNSDITIWQATTTLYINTTSKYFGSLLAQAIVVGFLASVVAMIMGWIPEGKFNLHHGLLLCASSMFTAAVASLALGVVMVMVVVLSRKLKINPDNVATPIAASLGDLITLSLLAGVSLVLYNSIGKHVWLAPSIIGILVALVPLWLYISIKNQYTNEVVYSGWTPVLSAMFISSIGGLILDFTVGKYHGIAVFQPVINGVGGNLVAVHASRLTTSLHLVSKPGKLPPTATHGCPYPGGAFCDKTANSRAARVLLSLVIPGHLIFMFTISYMKAGHTSITFTFAGIYLFAACLQVVILLYLAHWLVHFVWRLGEDPDNIAIPYLTAIGDLLGTLFLAIAFHILYVIGDKDADVGD